MRWNCKKKVTCALEFREFFPYALLSDVILFETQGFHQTFSTSSRNSQYFGLQEIHSFFVSSIFSIMLCSTINIILQIDEYNTLLLFNCIPVTTKVLFENTASDLHYFQLIVLLKISCSTVDS